MSPSSGTDKQQKSQTVISAIPESPTVSLQAPSRHILLSAIVAFPSAFLAPILWTLVLLGGNLGLPFLVSRIIEFSQSYSSADLADDPVREGWGLVGATALLFLVIAVSTGQVRSRFSLSRFTQVRETDPLLLNLFSQTVTVVDFEVRDQS